MVHSGMSAIAAQRARAADLLAFLVSRYGTLTAHEAHAAAERAGHPNADAAGLITITVHGRQVYPGFQFTGQTIRPDWATLTRPFRDTGWTDDQIALWFAAPTGWLNGARPADLLDSQPATVREAIANVTAPAWF